MPKLWHVQLQQPEYNFTAVQHQGPCHFIKKGTTVARMVAGNKVPEMVVADGVVGAL